MSDDIFAAARDDKPPQVPIPFPPDFDVEDGPCLCCGGALDTGWECNDCGADHRPGVMLLTQESRGRS